MVRYFNRFISRLQRIFLVSPSWHFDLFCQSNETILKIDLNKKSRSENRAAFFILILKVQHLNRNKFRVDNGVHVLQF